MAELKEATKEKTRDGREDLEMFPNEGAPDQTVTEDNLMFPGPPTTPTPYRFYEQALSEYSQRKLSFQADVLNAIAGILNPLVARMGSDF